MGYSCSASRGFSRLGAVSVRYPVESIAVASVPDYRGARREWVETMPTRRIRCPQHLEFLTLVFTYKSYVEYWNGTMKEMEPRRRRVALSSSF